ncbi:hypothetical protein [Mesorhizobium sp. CAU 1741]|uniref:hypothetical protein n=1 Tax=Mesorhizobium sp. CAU 1741 TaxID=3140366 RepID=UPI00325ABB53
MSEFTPPDMRSLLGKVMKASPTDIKFMAQRLHDHAFEPRMSAEATRAFARELGHEDLKAFCLAIGLPAHVAERWDRFGLSAEIMHVLTFMLAERQRLVEAIDEFEANTHVGVDDFLRERGLL